MGQIRKQTIYSSLIIYLGFVLGAFNLLILFPKVIPVEYIGLTRLIQDFSTLILSFAGLGFAGPFYRFSPHYEKYCKPGQNDFFQLYMVVVHIGLLITLSICFIFNNQIISYFQDRSPLFAQYYFTTFVFGYLLVLYNTIEMYAFTKGQAIVPAISRELILRVILFVLALASFIGLQMHSFVWVYASHYLVPLLVLLVYLFKKYPFKIGIPFSKVTKRLKKSIFEMSFMGFIQVLVTSSVPVLDTLVIGSTIGLVGVAEYQIMSYISTLIHVPVRATISIIGAKLAQRWLEDDKKSIQTIYSRTSINYLAFALLACTLVLINFKIFQFLIGKNINIEFKIIVILIIAKIFEMSAGLSNLVLAYSKNWKVENYISIINILLAIPLNIYMVKTFGLIGAAYTTLILMIFASGARIIVNYVYFKLFPYNTFTLVLLGLGGSLSFAAYYLSLQTPSYYYKLIISMLYSAVFAWMILRFGFSEDLTQIYQSLLLRIKNRSRHDKMD